jgi:hypothetical protein
MSLVGAVATYSVARVLDSGSYGYLIGFANVLVCAKGAKRLERVMVYSFFCMA